VREPWRRARHGRTRRHGGPFTWYFPTPSHTPPRPPPPLPAALTLRVPKRAVPADMVPKLRYYSASMHDAAFKLPVFAESKLASVRPAAAAVAKPLLAIETPVGLAGLLAVPALALAAGYLLAAKKL
jgi:hypothetical protein